MAAQDFLRVTNAVILYDLKTRFGGSYAGFVISLLWPLVHLSVLFAIYYFRMSIASNGDDPASFVFTGLAPFIFALYPARFTSMVLLQNRQLLAVPAVRPFNIIAARVLIEVVSCFVVLVLFGLLLHILELAQTPLDKYKCATTLGAVLVFGIGFGVFGIIVTLFQPLVGVMFVVLTIIGLYILSDAILPVSVMAHNYIELLWYNPLFQAVHLLRASYFSDINSDEFSVLYVFSVGAVMLWAGLLSVHLFRGKFFT